jgi:hypothetical protein
MLSQWSMTTPRATAIAAAASVAAANAIHFQSGWPVRSRVGGSGSDWRRRPVALACGTSVAVDHM